MTSFRQAFLVFLLLSLSGCASYVPPTEGPVAQFTFINNSTLQPLLNTFADQNCKGLQFFKLPKDQQGNLYYGSDSETRIKPGGKWTTPIRADRPFIFELVGGQSLGLGVGLQCHYQTQLIPSADESYEMTFGYQPNDRLCKLKIEKIGPNGERAPLSEPEFRSDFGTKFCINDK